MSRHRSDASALGTGYDRPRTGGYTPVVQVINVGVDPASMDARRDAIRIGYLDW
jgi:hypothetical protein